MIALYSSGVEVTSSVGEYKFGISSDTALVLPFY